MKVVKKDNTLEDYNEQKIIDAVDKSAARIMYNFSSQEYGEICNAVLEEFDLDEDESMEDKEVSVFEIHAAVEKVLLEKFPEVGKCYQQYRNYKLDFVKMMDDVYQKSQEIRYIGDVSNANADSTMISTQRSLIYGVLNKELYKKFFLNSLELQAVNDGYIYPHDMKDRLDGINCCLFDVKSVLEGGFEMGNLWYNEPKTLDTAFNVISDIMMCSASQQYGGYTVCEVDKLLSKYAEASYKIIYDEYIEEISDIGLSKEEIHKKADRFATKKVYRQFEQGFQGWEMSWNSVGSSRGDYTFVTISFGTGTSKFEKMATEVALKVRMNGQGKEGFKKPVLFPKLTFLYDENLHGANKPLEYLFDIAIDCSSTSMYPDFLSLTGDGYIPSMYKKYGRIVSLMGCRASLSPWYERGGMHPADEDDKPTFVGRCNLGAITLNLPMILAKSRHENKDFYEVLNYYLEMIRGLHKRTYAFLGEKKASTNPLAWMQGGLGGHLKADEKIKPLLKAFTMSFGVTALNELQQLYNGKSLYEDGEFALEVMRFINDYVNRIKEEDQILYAVYAVPAESLCGLQVEQFRKKYGIVQNVSDKPYVSNSFHCHVSEDITPIQKQDSEKRFWDLFNGGKIQYCRYPISYNKEAIKTLVRRAMDLGFYEGINLSLAYCEDCGYEQLEMDICPKCGSEMITKIDRMNGYLGYTRVKGKTRYNEPKNAEIRDRISM